MRGQTLIEALAALSIIAIVVSSIAAVIIVSLNNAQFSKNKTLAAQYAQQGMELMRQFRNSDYNTFKTYNGLYCFGEGQTNLTLPQTSCTSLNIDTFVRSIRIEQSPGCGSNVAKVSVEVAWNDGKCQSSSVYCHRELNSSCFSTVNPVAPL